MHLWWYNCEALVICQYMTKENKIKRTYFEIIFMNRFSDEKIPAALSNKDAPCSEFSFTSPNITCTLNINKQNKSISHRHSEIQLLQLKHLILYFKKNNLEFISHGTLDHLFCKKISVWSVLVIIKHLPQSEKWLRVQS